jgi:Holliday junction DNA helicase RuvA
MIAYLQGRLVQKTPTHLILDVNGVGYLVHIPLSSYDKAGSPGDVVRVLTYLHVREECMELFGFMTEEERELFKSLIVVSGVGPRLARSILSGLNVADFQRAVSREDVRLLTSIPGVGKSTSKRPVRSPSVERQRPKRMRRRLWWRWDMTIPARSG